MDYFISVVNRSPVLKKEHKSSDYVKDDREILTIDQRPLSTVTHPVVYVVDVKRWMYSLKLREDTMPMISRERGIPFELLPVVEQKLKDLVSKGVLVETSQVDWASAIVVVRKADGNIRICGGL